MGSFSADWLALREPADAAARSSRLTRALANALGSRDTRVLDLACGTGANLRYLAPRLPAVQRWLLVDRDEDLLGQVPARMSAWAAARGYTLEDDADALLIRGGAFTCHLVTARRDLLDADRALYAGCDLVTASALLDLVSEPWLGTLAAACAQSGAAVLFALSYDGRIACAPEESQDELVRTLVNAHQRTDKGFGTAAGPDAADILSACLARRGYEVHREPSDWVLDSGAGPLQERLIADWAEAAALMGPEHAHTIESWRQRRLAHVAAGRSRLIVGHIDLAAWPAEKKKERRKKKKRNA